MARHRAPRSPPPDQTPAVPPGADADALGLVGAGFDGPRRIVGNDNQYRPWKGDRTVARNEVRPIIKLRSTANTGYTYVTRKSRRNDPDRLRLRKYDPVAGRHVEFREER
jgi:large subunit ribosomal protein L33